MGGCLIILVWWTIFLRMDCQGAFVVKGDNIFSVGEDVMPSHLNAHKCHELGSRVARWDEYHTICDDYSTFWDFVTKLVDMVETSTPEFRKLIQVCVRCFNWDKHAWMTCWGWVNSTMSVHPNLRFPVWWSKLAWSCQSSKHLDILEITPYNGLTAWRDKVITHM